MSTIQTEHLKYGIGITADYSPLALSTRTFEKRSLDCVGDRVEVNIDNQEIGIADNALYQFLAEEVKDAFVITIEKDTELFPLDIKAVSESALGYIHIHIKQGVTVTIHEQLFPRDFIGCIIDITVEEQASVTYIADQRCSSEKNIIVLRRGFVGEGATLRWIDIAVGGAIANSTIYTLLDAPKARGEVYGLFFGNDSQLHDIAHTTVHRAPHTTSNLKTNGALDGHGKAIYRSLIDIRDNAFTSVGHQKEETLLLSRDAQISAVPDLEIANNEVSCSHGVSTTNIDEDALFYFHSRGMDTDEAKRAIVEGHLAVIIDIINDESLRMRVHETLRNAYKPIL